MKVALIGQGYLGSAYSKVFKDAVIYDPIKLGDKSASKKEVNECDISIIAVPTDPMPDGSLDMSIIEEVVNWVETDLILIKSALMPGTVDSLVKKTGKKIAVSLEMIGMGNYYLDPSKYPDPLDPQKHQTLIVGGELETATKCAEVLWDKMSPNIRIHLLTAKEVEICKLIENSYGALKVTFINCMYDLITKSGGNFIRSQQAWSSDSRVDGVHMRTLSYKRGWKSHCWSKDIPALEKYSKDIGDTGMAKLMRTVIELNDQHYGDNNKR